MKINNTTVIFLGSSIVYGAGASGVSFAEVMRDKLDLNMVKEAVSGTTLADVNEMSYVSRLKTLPTDIKPSLFICQLSTNDTNLKKVTDLVMTNQALRFIIEYARDVYHCPIMFFTQPRYKTERYQTLVDMLYGLQHEYNFPILDFWNDETMRDPADFARYTTDNVHPNIEGYTEWWTPKFIEFIEKL